MVAQLAKQIIAFLRPLVKSLNRPSWFPRWAIFVTLRPGMKIHDRAFVLTWWAGLVRDTFGPKSLFHVARFGDLRIRRVSLFGGGSPEGKPPKSERLCRRRESAALFNIFLNPKK